LGKGIARGRGIEEELRPAGKKDPGATRRRTDEEVFIALGSLVKGIKQNIRKSKHDFT
jgi:hypothetical protein